MIVSPTLKATAIIHFLVLVSLVVGFLLGYVVGTHETSGLLSVAIDQRNMQNHLDNLTEWVLWDRDDLDYVWRQVSTLQVEWNAAGVTNPVGIARGKK